MTPRYVGGSSFGGDGLRRRRRSRGLRWFFMLALACSAGAAFWFRSAMPPKLKLPGMPPTRAEAASPSGAPAGVASSAPARPTLPDLPPPPSTAPVYLPRVDLPPLERSDPELRTQAWSLSDHPLVRTGLSRSGLIETMVGATLEICEGRSPTRRLSYLRPEAPFSVQGAEDSPVTRPESYARYDAVVDAFVGLDAVSAVRLYREFEPLFDQAYAKFGYPNADFDEMAQCALRKLLATPVVRGEIALRPKPLRYEYADPELQGLEPIQRQLLRLGPKNVARVLAQLRELQNILQGSGAQD